MRLKTQENDHEALESEFLSDPFASWVFALVKGMWMILRHKPPSQAVLVCILKMPMPMLFNMVRCH